MTKDVLDAMTLLKEHLINSELTTSPLKPSGKIVIGQRLTNSKTEDVIINSLYHDFEQLQRGVLNINVYVPNLKSDNAIPNINRLNQLGKLILPIIKDEFGDPVQGYTFWLERQLFLIDDNHQHYLNNRIQFRNINLN